MKKNYKKKNKKKDQNIPNEPLKVPKYWLYCPSSTLIEYRYIENALICSD